MSKGKILTADLILTKNKADSLFAIKNLNLWGNDLEDLKILSEMPNLEVLSLSVNRISSLRDFSMCPHLQELYLRKNNISDIRQIRYLTKLSELRVLWLYDNPCTNIDNYRLIVLKYLPNLTKLDNDIVSAEERETAKLISFDIGLGLEAESKEKKSLKDIKKESSPAFEHKRSQKPEPSTKAPTLEVQKTKDTKQQSILQALAILLKELDIGSLEIAKKEVQKLLEIK